MIGICNLVSLGQLRKGAVNMSRSSTLFLASLGIGYLIGAITRGYYLLGPGTSVVFGLLAAATIFLIYRVYFTKGNFQVVFQIVVPILSVGVIAFMIFPTHFFPNLSFSIEEHQLVRAIRARLNDILSSDSRFDDIDFDFSHRKCLILTIRGRVKTKADLLELCNRIYTECPKDTGPWIDWDVTVQETGETDHGDDLSMSSESKDNTL
jgi:hypothetical protein